MADRPFLSLSMIVKNEEASLDDCLASAKALCDELVVVDTGSTDRTVEIARRHGAKLFHFEWCDDFAAARNFALEHTTGTWVLHLDADEVAVEAASGAVRAELAGQPESVQFLRVPVRSRGRDASTGEEHLARRLYRRHVDVRWTRRIHENVVNLRGEPAGCEAFSAAVVVDHDGYADPERRRSLGKNDRNVRLLAREILENPNDPLPHFYLAREQAAAAERSAALQTCRTLLDRFKGKLNPALEWAIRCHAMRCALSMDDFASAVALAEPVEAGCRSAELLYTLGHARLQLKALDGAERSFEQALALGSRPGPLQTKPGCSSWRPLMALGNIEWERGKREEAFELWRRSVAAGSNVAVTHLGLGRMLVATGQPGAAVPLLERALELEPRLHEAHLRLSEAAVALGDAQAAYDRLDALVRAEPGVAEHWQWLGDLLVSLGENEAAVEVLGRAIEHHQDRAGVYISLGLALEKLGRHEDALNAFALASAIDPTSVAGRAGIAVAAYGQTQVSSGQ